MSQSKSKYITEYVSVEPPDGKGIDSRKVSEDVMKICNQMDENGYEVLSIQKIDDIRRSPVKVTERVTKTVSFLITGVRKDAKKIIED